ncbi:MAG: hypothetical protein AT710_02450 [Thermocladium sp. ECH_B]|nr:MAG: hypothetical protein AT710_02450 [Thermocladium sp. ECH_B]
MLTPRTVELMDKLVTALDKLDGSGLLDALTNLASSDVISELARIFLTADLVKTLNGIDNLLKLASELSDADATDGLIKLVRLIKAINGTGLIDSMSDIVGDPEVIGEASRALLSTGLIHLLNNLDELSKALASIDFKALTKLLTALSQGLTEGPKQTESLDMVKKLLSSTDAKKGLSMLINVLEKMGSTT